MISSIARSAGAGSAKLLSALVFLLFSGCAILPQATIVPAQQATAASLPSDEDDFPQLVAQLRSDLNRYNSREIAKAPSMNPEKQTAKARDREFAERAKALFAPLSGSNIEMPVVGVHTYDLDDSWHAPRDGGVRVHKGIDIFAKKGTPVVAVADGIVSYIGDQPKGGHCIWLTTESGTAFYYAHLDRWAAGLYEGMEVQAGDLIGYVGNTGNAKYTPSHLHFGINENDDMVNPYPILTHAIPTLHAHVHTTLSGGPVATR